MNRRFFFEGWLTGDLSRFPEVCYNDPQNPPNNRFQGLIDGHRDELDAVLSKSPTGPIGARTGELAARMADTLWRKGTA